MKNWLNRYADPIYCLLRILTGLMFACHGGTKLFSFPPSQYSGAANALTITAGSIELIGGFLVALGLLTRLAAFICSGEMAVAYFMTSVPRGFFPISNGGEMAALYCFVFLYIFFHGAGSWSLDSLVTKREA